MLLNLHRGRFRAALLLVLLTVLAGCSSLRPDFRQPEVSVTGLRLGALEGLRQQVFVDLAVMNPNGFALDLAALHYDIEVEGVSLASGTSRDRLRVAAGGEVRYTVPASVHLLNSASLAMDLLTRPRERLHYRLSAELEPASGFWRRPIPVRHDGVVDWGAR